MRTRVAHAPTITKSASLAEDFGLEYATRLFGENAIDSIPKLQTGKNKGKPKGHVMWLKTTAKGYHPMGCGGVGEGQILWAWIGDGPYTPRENATVGFWMGRWQALSSSYGLLSEKARTNDIRDRLRERNEAADDLRHGRPEENQIDILARLTDRAERQAKWDAEDAARSARAFPNDPQRRAYDAMLRTLRTFGPWI